MSTGPNQILLKRSDTVTSVPSGLSFGEPGINTASGKLFFQEQIDGTVTGRMLSFHGFTNESFVTDVNGSTGSIAVVNSLNGLTGTALIKAGTNITLTAGAGGITVDAFVAGSNVTSFNGVTGAVEGVGSFNGATGAITTSGLHLHVAGLSVDGGITFSDGTTMSTAFTNVLKVKLDAIEASADVTDAANVTSAGALMDSELTSIANVKALDQSVVSGASPTFGTANFTDASNKRLMTDAQESKLNGVEASADVTDATNVTSAGALMDSELASIADVKALDQSVVSGANPVFTFISALAGISVGAGGVTFSDGTQTTTALRTDSYTGQIETAADKTYTLDPKVATARTITGFFIKCASGTVTATLKNGTDTIKAASVSDSSGDQSSLGNTGVAADAVITMVTSSNSSALDVIFNVEYTAAL